MGKRSVTQRLIRAGDPECKSEIIQEWLESWKIEQIKLNTKLSIATNIHDIDNAMISIGQLRAVINKKFTALYNILSIINLSAQTKPGGKIYEYGRFQTAIIAISGRKLAEQDWNELQHLSRKLDTSTNEMFNVLKNILTDHFPGDRI